MFNLKRLSIFSFLLLIVIIFCGLAACNPKPTPIEPLSTEEVNETLQTEEAKTQETPLAIDENPAVVFVQGNNIDPAMRDEILMTIEALASESALDLVIKDEIHADTISPGVKIVVGIGEGLGLDTLAASSPGLTFVAIEDPNAVAANNLSVIGNPAVEIQQQMFMAGYLSALIAEDNRVAAIISENNSLINVLAENFVSGARFYCGICKPILPPYNPINPFPQWETLPQGVTADEYQPLINAFDSVNLDVLFVHGELHSSELLDYINEAGISVISDHSPDVIRGNWAGTVSRNPAQTLLDLWPGLMEGAAGVQVPAEIMIMDTEMGLIKGGRFRLFEQTLADLKAGLIAIEYSP